MEKDQRKIYGLIGYPLGHSFSKDYFNRKFETKHIDAEYKNFELEKITDFRALMSTEPSISGLNVTIPYKTSIIPFLDLLDEEAEKIGAVNVIKFIYDHDGLCLKGFNSDVKGFSLSIQPLLKPEHRKALVLGTGGASKAVVRGLINLGIEPNYVSRNPEAPASFTYDELTRGIIDEHLVIVNTTPLGMYPNVDSSPNIPYRFITPRHLCYDLVYNPAETLFMKKCAEHGATVKNGHEMLILQAEAAWDIWNS